MDLGSNTARLVIYRYGPTGPPWSVFESKETPRLAAGIDRQGRLSGDAQARALEALGRFERILLQRGVRRVSWVATSAVRDAPNQVAFASAVRRRLRFPLRVLSGAAEARYGFLGVASSLPLARHTVVDLGGGSIQVMRVTSGRLDGSRSLPLGALRLHTRFLHNDPPKRRELAELESHVEEALEDVDALDIPRGSEMVAVGGTARCLAHVLQATRGYPLRRVHGYVLRERDLENLYGILRETSVSLRREVPGLSADRADIVVAGLAVFLGLLKHLKQDRMVVAGTGLREGVAQELLGRPVPPSAEAMCRESAESALAAFAADVPHARVVEGLALQIFDELRSVHELAPPERRALSVAALLHDAGIPMSFADHPEHSSSLIRHRTLYGLNHREIVLASLAVAMHEGDEPPGGLMKRYPSILAEGDGDQARALGSMLALAEALGEGPPRVQVRYRKDRLEAHLPRGCPARPRALERARRLLGRHLDLDVRVRAG